MAGVQNPSKLSELSLSCVGKNISNVYVGNVPEIIGKDLFFSAYRHEALDSDSLERFATKYDCVLVSLKCRNLNFLNAYSDMGLIAMSIQLTRLDLSNCELGKDPYNEYLRCLGNLKKLKVLNLANNGIGIIKPCDMFYRLIFSGHRKYDNGFLSLETLDVSKNYINMKMLNFLLGLPSLSKISLSIFERPNQRINSSSYNEVSRLTHRKNFKLVHHGTESVIEVFENEGWGTCLISYWERQFSKSKMKDLDVSRKKNFYSFKPLRYHSKFLEDNIENINPRNFDVIYTYERIKPIILTVRENKRTVDHLDNDKKDSSNKRKTINNEISDNELIRQYRSLIPKKKI